MKNFLKVIFINIVLIIFVILLIEFIALSTYCRESAKGINDLYSLNSKDTNITTYKKELSHYKSNYFQDYFKIDEFRKVSESKNSKYPSIILMGCSFTYGNGLNDEETFSSQLSHYTNYTVYNLGLDGASIRESLYILRTPTILNKLISNKKNIKYVIFTFIDDQMVRLHSDVYRIPEPKFIPDKNYTSLKYKETKFSFYRSFFYFYISRHFAFKKSIQENNKLFNLYVKELNREIKKQFSNNEEETKLVLLIYNNYNNYDWNELKQNGITIIDLKDLTDTDLEDLKYKIYDKFHPNAKAWEVIVPALAKELNL